MINNGITISIVESWFTRNIEASNKDIKEDLAEANMNRVIYFKN